ncbi:hypothetical protein MIR68_010467 [Amoeboaphelidium protococcarum]|nr:hypothetical protein MIR68_010467 [Amoeboaphelidium protococcarum]
MTDQQNTFTLKRKPVQVHRKPVAEVWSDGKSSADRAQNGDDILSSNVSIKGAQTSTSVSMMNRVKSLRRHRQKSSVDTQNSLVKSSSESVKSQSASSQQSGKPPSSIVRHAPVSGQYQTQNKNMLLCNEQQMDELLDEMLCDMAITDQNHIKKVKAMSKDSKWLLLQQHHQKGQQIQQQLQQQQVNPMRSAKKSNSDINSIGYNLQDLSHGLVDSIMKFGTLKQQSKVDKSTPEYYAQSLQRYVSLQSRATDSSFTSLLVSLKIDIGSQPLNWLSSFLALNGLRLLHQVSLQSGDQSAQIEAVKCMKALVNSQQGIQELSQQWCFDNFVGMLLRSCLSVRRIVTEILTVLIYAYNDDGDSNVKLFLSACKTLMISLKAQFLFGPWIGSLMSIVQNVSGRQLQVKQSLVAGVGWIGENKVTEREVQDFLTCNMLLINGIMNNLLTASERVYIRQQFSMAQLNQVLVQLHSMAMSHEILRRQLELYDGLAADDFETLRQDLFGNSSHGETSLQQSLALLAETVKDDNVSLKHLESIVLLLKLAADGEQERQPIYQMLNYVIQQVVFCGKGVQTNWSNMDMQFNMEIVMKEFQAQSDVNKYKFENARLKAKIEQLKGEKVLVVAGAIRPQAKLQINQLEKNLCEIHSLLQIDKSANGVGKEQSHNSEEEELVANYRQESEVNAVVKRDSGIDSLKGSQGYAAGLCSTDVVDDNNTTTDNVATNDSPVLDALMSYIPPPPVAPPFVQKPPKKPLYLTKLKMKQLQWEKVPAHELDQTLWNNLDSAGEDDICRILTENNLFQYLESEFAQVSGKSAQLISSDESLLSQRQDLDELESKVAKSPAKSLLDPKKSYNLTILLKRIKDVDQLLLAIDIVDAAVISEVCVNQILQFLPSSDEIALISSVQLTHINSLPIADQFMVQLLGIQNYELKLRIIQLKFSNEESLMDIQSGLEIVQSSLKEIKESQSLKQFLQLVLSIGNVMNVNSFRGGAYGFKISALQSLLHTQSIRSNDWTMLHFILDIASRHYPSALEFLNQLDSLHEACRISVSVIVQNFKSMYQSVSMLHSQCSKLVNSNCLDSGQDDEVLHRQLQFLSDIESQLSSIKPEYDSLEQTISQFLTWLGEDPRNCTWESVAKELSTFVLTAKRVLQSVQDKQQSQQVQKLSASSDDDVVSTTKYNRLGNEELSAQFSSLKQQLPVRERQQSVNLMDSILEQLKLGLDPSSLIPGQQKDMPQLQRRPIGQSVQYDSSSERRRISVSQHALQAAELLSQLDAI